MAKTYDFRIVIRKAEFSNGFVSVPFGGVAYVYAEVCPHCTLAEAIQKRQELSDLEQRPHVASISMKYREDRKAPGIGKVKTLQASREITP